MKRKMTAAVMTGIRQIGLQEREIPVPGPGEVLIRVEYVGICGSDLHFYEHGAIGDVVVHPPFVLGHEVGGIVEELGPGVNNLKPGDRVALEPGRTCGHCEFCRTGRYNLCPDVVFYSTPPYDGAFQEYVTHEAGLCFRIPDSMDTMEAALIEPLAVGFHAAAQGSAHVGMTAAVMGAGCIGLVSIMALKAMGVTRIISVDIMEKRLSKALELGAAHIIDGSRKDAAEELLRLTDGKGTDLVIETAGTEATVRQAIRSSKKGSTIVLVGYSATGEMTLPLSMVLDKELTIKTCYRYRHIYPMAIEAVASGRVNLKGIVSNVFPLREIENAMEQSLRNKADIVKAVIKI